MPAKFVQSGILQFSNYWQMADEQLFIHLCATIIISIELTKFILDYPIAGFMDMFLRLPTAFVFSLTALALLFLPPATFAEKPDNSTGSGLPDQKQQSNGPLQITAKEILGNTKYQAISFGGYRGKSREQGPTVEQLQEDIKILSAMGIKVLRTYNTQQFSHASNLLKAIRLQKQKQSDFEMYVMLGRLDRLRECMDCEPKS